MIPGETSAPSSAWAGTGSHRKEPALCWVASAVLKCPQALALPSLGGSPSSEGASSLRAFPATPFPSPLSWCSSSSRGWDQPTPSAGMRQQPSCAPVPDGAGLLGLTPFLQHLKYVRSAQENNSTRCLEATGWGRAFPTVNSCSKSHHPAPQDLGSLLWHPRTEPWAGRVMASPSGPAFLPGLLRHEGCG